jgi:ABC-2 type transport system permease protein
MSVLSGLWIPIFAFPPLMQKLAMVWPAWHLGQLALGVVGQVQDVRYSMHVAVLLAITALFLTLAAARLRKA